MGPLRRDPHLVFHRLFMVVHLHLLGCPDLCLHDLEALHPQACLPLMVYLPEDLQSIQEHLHRDLIGPDPQDPVSFLNSHHLLDHLHLEPHHQQDLLMEFLLLATCHHQVKLQRRMSIQRFFLLHKVNHHLLVYRLTVNQGIYTAGLHLLSMVIIDQRKVRSNLRKLWAEIVQCRVVPLQERCPTRAMAIMLAQLKL